MEIDDQVEIRGKNGDVHVGRVSRICELTGFIFVKIPSSDAAYRNIEHGPFARRELNVAGRKEKPIS